MKIISKLITHLNPKSPISEAYRTLRTNIQFSNIDNEIKTIAVTSSDCSEGKSTIISNLAVTMAQSGKKVLLIDCDLRRPDIHKIFRMSNYVGFINILVEDLEMDKVIRDVQDVEGLKILTSGPIPPNPSEILNSTKAKVFIQKLKENFDVILIDSPPVGVVTDAAILSTYVDGIILVAGYGQVGVESIKEAKELLVKVNANIIGTVLNKVPIKKRKYSGKYYYGYYDYNKDEE